MDEFRDAMVALSVLVSLVAEVRRPPFFLAFGLCFEFLLDLLDGDGLKSTFA